MADDERVFLVDLRRADQRPSGNHPENQVIFPVPVAQARHNWPKWSDKRIPVSEGTY